MMDYKKMQHSSFAGHGSSQTQLLRASILDKLKYACSRTPANAGLYDWYIASVLAVRDRLVDGLLQSQQLMEHEPQKKRVYYLSIEYLIGRLLFDSLINLRLLSPARAALDSLGIDIDQLRRLEPDAALGNGGLGRLAACYADSMAALAIPAVSYGIRYEHGLFHQEIRDGWQQEHPERWLAFGNPWEFERLESEYSVCFGGHVEYVGGEDGQARGIWYPSERVLAVAYDTPIGGWRGRHVNMLRLWSARTTTPMHLATFNSGDVVAATAPRAQAEAISRVLYPSDVTPLGQELRLRQEYFFTSASLQDIIRRHLHQFEDLHNLPDCAAIQLNDTHPAIAVAELMRILIDEHDYHWDDAWRITSSTLHYTNHTLLPEALESWPVALLNRLLPRQMQIIFVINKLHLDGAMAKGFTDPEMLSSISLVQEGYEKRVRMGHLAFIGSRRVNGVSALHTKLMSQTVFSELDKVLPGRITNVTNGITFRRWLLEANPPLTGLITRSIGEGFLDDTSELVALDRLADDAGFRDDYAQTRRTNKENLAQLIRELVGVKVDPRAMFDVHIKRIHEYKRQLLNLLETIALYLSIRTEPTREWTPRVKIFAGKAAPNYARAKLIIKLANDIAHIVNADPTVGDRLKVIFLPNYGISLAQKIIPASDLSEQISTAGMEASGTGNMKLALNGAITIGTLDGANIEIRDRVGAENIAIFGLTAGEVDESRGSRFTGSEAAERSPLLAQAISCLRNGTFSPDQPDLYHTLCDALLGYDHFMVGADFDDYWRAQRRVDERFETSSWWKSAILNTSRMGWFSSDRAIREYATRIWNIEVPLPAAAST